MSGLDWAVVAAYCVIVLVIGVWVQRRGAGDNTDNYFLSGRSLPWWIAGASMAASAFSADTPMYVAKLTQGRGVWGNWEWWFMGVSGILGATVMARYWRRAGIMTDLELITQRYSGRPAEVLRGFRAVFFGLLINPLAMTGVIVAMIKILGVVEPTLVDEAGWPQGYGAWLIGGVILVAVLYSVLSGFMGVVLTDLLQFVVSMVGATVMAVFAVRQVGGLEKLRVDPNVADKLAFMPELSPWGDAATAFAIFLGVLWWSFVNADGGGKYIQRMASCADERDAELATWFSTITFVALRSWPWILVGLAGLVLFPGTPDPENVYPRMMMRLPAGLRGFVFASLIAAFMSTIDTQLNWGASYLVNDLLKPYVLRDRSERFYVLAAKLVAIPTLLVVAVFFVLGHQDESQVLSVTRFLRGVILVSSGLGAVYLLRWFWWRLTAWGEIAAMAAAPITAAICKHHELSFAPSTLTVTLVTLGTAAAVSLVGPGVDRKVLEAFVARVRPAGFWGDLRAADQTQPGAGRWLLLRFLSGNAILFGLSFSLGGLLLGKGPLVVLGNLGVFAGGLFVDRYARRRTTMEPSTGEIA